MAGRCVSTITTLSAIRPFSGVVIAESDDTIVVDGYRYFPAASVHDEHLIPSTHHSVCGWKGQASYYDVTVARATDQNAAWYYADPKPAAGMVVGYIGFWHGVRIEVVHEPCEPALPAGRDG